MGTFSSGTRLGPYEIQSAIGAGGMGEVYRARDTRLQRDVAIKALPEAMAGAAERVARFEREAQVLASLNHPNIGAIYGLEEFGGRRYLVLEFIDGQSLADRIALGALPLDEAVAVARQILDALEAAHEKGIVHRDIKPSNIMLTADGVVKVLDFGLARVGEPDQASDTSNSPTLTAQATQPGMILGTAAYMSPEQTKGRAADKRCDVWAFGCVLYEMLTGRRAFAREDVTETLAAVLRDDPNWTDLPASVSPAIRTLIRRCLDRDRKARIPEIATVRFLLMDALAMPTGAARTMAEPQRTWRRALPIAAAVITTGALASAATWYLRPSTRIAVTRFSFSLLTSEGFSGTGRHILALSPAGTDVMYVANSRLNIRSISALRGKPIPGSEAFGNVTDPVFSPDGKSVAFFAGSDGTLKRMATTGGGGVTLCAATNPFGMQWVGDEIVFGQGSKGAMRVAATGGTPTILVEPKPGEIVHRPQLLPGGRAVLFTSATGTAPDRWDKAEIVVQTLPAGPRKTVLAGAADARYLESGVLVYASRGVLFTVPFDARRLEVTGPPIAAVEGVRRAYSSTTGAAQFDVSPNGTLIYVPGPVVAGSDLEVGLADRKGTIERLNVPAGPYQTPRASPDGSRLALGSDDGKEASILVYELSGATAIRRLTFGGADRFPVWSSDGKRVAFQSDREGDQSIFWILADGSAPPERLTKANPGEQHVPTSWSPKGDAFLFSVVAAGPRVSSTLWIGSLPDKKTRPFGDVHSTTPIGAVFSPDGQWVAYSSTDQNKTSAFVQPYPPTGVRYQLVTKDIDAPSQVTWSPDGSELVYWPRPDGFEAVKVVTKPTFGFANPVPVLRRFTISGPAAHREYDVLKDGRFVALMTPGQASSQVSPEIVVVVNWLDELRQRGAK